MRETIAWQHDGRDYQVRVEGNRILWADILQLRGGWRRLQLHGPTVALFARQHDLPTPSW